MRIDLVYFSDNATAISWEHGEVYSLPLNAESLTKSLNHILESSTADWLYFHDDKLGKPNDALIVSLAITPVDVWHAGVKLGLVGLPHMINYINPAWIYNRDVKSNIISSSFRLSLRCCLIRAQILKNNGGLPHGYSSIDMSGLALGYQLIKKGAVLRYHPELVGNNEEPAYIPELDEWKFLKQFFPAKWQWWVMLNKPSFFKNYSNWRKAGKINYKSLTPNIHESGKQIKGVSPKSVSILAPTIDRYSYLAAELEQLSMQTILPKEVLITDQTDKERRQIIDDNLYPAISIRCYPQEEKGQCIAWNKLLGEAEGEYVLFLGDDADDIKPDFIEKLLHTMQHFDADIVASHVIEIDAPQKQVNHHFYMSDTFPITLAKKKLINDAGNMDMFFNKNIRADYDLALRCHEKGALMIFDSSALILHHRAPVGGLRTFNARKITNRVSKNSITKFAEPTSSELYLVKKHFNDKQFKYFVRIKYFDQLMIKGSVLKKLARLFFFLIKLFGIKKRYKANLALAEAALRK